MPLPHIPRVESVCAWAGKVARLVTIISPSPSSSFLPPFYETFCLLCSISPTIHHPPLISINHSLSKPIAPHPLLNFSTFNHCFLQSLFFTFTILGEFFFLPVLSGGGVLSWGYLDPPIRGYKVEFKCSSLKTFTTPSRQARKSRAHTNSSSNNYLQAPGQGGVKDTGVVNFVFSLGLPQVAPADFNIQQTGFSYFLSHHSDLIHQ